MTETCRPMSSRRAFLSQDDDNTARLLRRLNLDGSEGLRLFVRAPEKAFVATIDLDRLMTNDFSLAIHGKVTQCEQWVAKGAYIYAVEVRYIVSRC
jgi:hypothetical protein